MRLITSARSPNSGNAFERRIVTFNMTDDDVAAIPHRSPKQRLRRGFEHYLLPLASTLPMRSLIDGLEARFGLDFKPFYNAKHANSAFRLGLTLSKLADEHGAFRLEGFLAELLVALRSPATVEDFAAAQPPELQLPELICEERERDGWCVPEPDRNGERY